MLKNKKYCLLKKIFVILPSIFYSKILKYRNSNLNLIN